MSAPRTYQSRETVQAMRFDGTRESADTIRDWLDEADPTNCLDIAIRGADRAKSSIWLGRTGPMVRCGEWLVRHPSGCYTTRTDAEFAAGFAEVH